MITVTPVTKEQYAAAKRKAFSGRRMKSWGGVCPICGKGAGGSGPYVFTNEDGTALLTEAEAEAYAGTLYVEPVGAACFKAHLTAEYRFTGRAKINQKVYSRFDN